MSEKTDKICCPICDAKSTWRPDNVFRPFCSYRCKLIDLGEWAEGRAIPGKSIPNPGEQDSDEEDL